MPMALSPLAPPPAAVSSAERPRMTIVPDARAPLSMTVRPGVKALRSRMSWICSRSSWSAPIAEMLIGVSSSVVSRRVAETMISPLPKLASGDSCANAGVASAVLVKMVADKSPALNLVRCDICCPPFRLKLSRALEAPPQDRMVVALRIPMRCPGHHEQEFGGRARRGTSWTSVEECDPFHLDQASRFNVPCASSGCSLPLCGRSLAGTGT